MNVNTYLKIRYIFLTTMHRPSIAQCLKKWRTIKGTSTPFQKDKNKGKAGLLLENLFNIPTSGDCWDCTDGEIKAFPVIRATSRTRLVKEGVLYPKETVAVTMCKPSTDLLVPFEQSKLRKKLSSVLFIQYKENVDNITWVNEKYFTCNHSLFKQIEKDYNEIQKFYKNHGITKSKVGKLLQVRTKGPGGDKKSWAFYLRKQFMINLFAQKPSIKIKSNILQKLRNVKIKLKN